MVASDPPLEKDSSVGLDQIRVASFEKRIHSVACSLGDSTMGEIEDVLILSLGLN